VLEVLFFEGFAPADPVQTCTEGFSLRHPQSATVRALVAMYAMHEPGLSGSALTASQVRGGRAGSRRGHAARVGGGGGRRAAAGATGGGAEGGQGPGLAGGEG